MLPYDTINGEINWSGDVKGVTGFSSEDFQSIDRSSWENLIHPDDHENTLKLLDNAMKKGEKYEVNYRLECKDGKYRYIEDNGSFPLDQNGKAYRMLGVMKDITERKQAEKEKAELQEQQELKYQNRLNALVIDLNSVLQKDEALEFIADSALNMLCSQVDAQVGTITIVIDGRLKRIAKRALSKLELNDSDEESLNRGGLVKEVIRQRTAMVLNDVPDNYLRCTSSIINSSPAEIHIIPLNYGAKTIGVCELAFMKEPASLSIDFLNLATENIAARFLTLGIA